MEAEAFWQTRGRNIQICVSDREINGFEQSDEKVSKTKHLHFPSLGELWAAPGDSQFILCVPGIFPGRFPGLAWLWREFPSSTPTVAQIEPGLT